MSNYDLKLIAVMFLLPPMVVTLGQAILNRLHKGSAQLNTIISMVFGYPIFFAIVGLLPFEMERNTVFYIYAFMLYSFSAYTYFHVFNMSETSRRVRMIAAIGNKSSAFDAGELDTLYDDKAMILARLNRLLALGQIKEVDGRYYGRGKLFVRTAIALYTIGLILARPWPPMRKFIIQKKKGRV